MKDRFGIDWTNIKGSHFWARPQLSRRLFFRHIAPLSAVISCCRRVRWKRVARAAGSPIGTAKNVIFVLMSGGPSHSDTFDLKEGSWTPSFMAPTSYGDIRWPQGIMPKLGEQMDNIALFGRRDRGRRFMSWRGLGFRSEQSDFRSGEDCAAYRFGCFPRTGIRQKRHVAGLCIAEHGQRSGSGLSGAGPRAILY